MTAFDTVDHDLLLQRLEHHFGLYGRVRQWIRSYLWGTTFRIVYRAMWRRSSSICHVLSSARLGPRSAVLHFIHGWPCGPSCQVRRVSSHIIHDYTQLYVSLHLRLHRNEIASFVDQLQRTSFTVKQEGQHPLTGQRAANFRLLANQW